MTVLMKLNSFFVNVGKILPGNAENKEVCPFYTLKDVFLSFKELCIFMNRTNFQSTHILIYINLFYCRAFILKLILKILYLYCNFDVGGLEI